MRRTFKVPHMRRSSLLRVPLLVVFLPFAASCGGCGDDALHDISCHPGDPAAGEYDEDLPEKCDNVIDDNCDGRINEGCECVDGETFTCGIDEGECASTTVTCANGRFPGCVPAKGPVTETCNGLDDDCDGATDGLSPVDCWEGPADAVLDGTAACRTGRTYCEDGAWSPCRGQVLPGDELCNGGIDDDCDGEADEDPVTDGRACGPTTSVGLCEFGEERCLDGESVCIGAVHGQTEACNAWVDDDCDGEVNEDLYRPCQTACGQGIESCAPSGAWVNCSAPTPGPELCDGFDNDCDGQADEGCPCVAGDAQTCRDGMLDASGDPISCGIGVQVCDINGVWGECRFFDTLDELCNDWDDDCDGVIDGQSRSCGDPSTAGIGECRLGEEICDAGSWGECGGAVAAIDETCNGLDDDCDGLVDEDLDPHDKVDIVIAVDESGSMCPYTSALAQGMAQWVQDFQGTEHRFSLVSFPGDGMSILPLAVRVPLTDAATFQAALAGLGCGGGGLEPSYDVLYQLADPADPTPVGWRSDAYPYIILIGDEPAQNLYGSMVTESMVAARTSNCGIGMCVPGDRVEAFVITKLVYQFEYDEIVYFEQDRIIEIEPPDANRYTQMLHDIFANVCIGGP